MRLMLSALALLLAVTGCSGGGGSSGSNDDQSTLQWLVSDAPRDDFSTFEVTLDGLFLEDGSGAATDNLLSAPSTVDLLALQFESRLIQVSRGLSGTWSDVRVTFDPGSLRARDLTGELVDVSFVESEARAAWPTPLRPTSGEFAVLDVEIDLEQSLSSGPSGWRFDPRLIPTQRRGEDRSLDEVHARVTAVNLDQRLLSTRLLERATDRDLGPLSVSWTATTTLYDDQGRQYSDEASFATAATNQRIEADGALAPDGTFKATSIRVDDSPSLPVRLRGVVLERNDSQQTLELRLTRVDRGHREVEDELQRLGNPASITLDASNSFIVFDGRNARRGSFADLQLGLEIQAGFSLFAAPFRPERIEIEGEPRFEGRIVDDSGRPDEVVIHLEPHDPAVLSGRVESSNTDVSVNLTGATLILDVSHEPSVDGSLLRQGLRIDPRGTLSGTPSTPHIDATSVRVRPGRLEGVVTGFDRQGGWLEVTWQDIDDPFGGDALPQPVVASLADDLRIDGDASNRNELYQRLEGLGSGETLELELQGLRTEDGVLAFDLDVKIDESR